MCLMRPATVGPLVPSVSQLSKRGFVLQSTVRLRPILGDINRHFFIAAFYSRC
jgi:hypothetical protein